MQIGPVEYVIIEFTGDRFSDDVAPELGDLVKRDVIRILDLVFVRKDADGNVAAFEFDELEDPGGFADIDGEADGLLNDEDIDELAATLAPDTSAAFILWEDRWAAPLAEAVRGAGGRVVGGERIPHEVVEAAVAALGGGQNEEATT